MALIVAKISSRSVVGVGAVKLGVAVGARVGVGVSVGADVGPKVSVGRGVSISRTDGVGSGAATQARPKVRAAAPAMMMIGFLISIATLR